MIAPVGAPSFPEAVRWGKRGSYHALKSILKKKGFSTGVGDEGGFAPVVPSNLEPAALITEANTAGRGMRREKRSPLVLDPAASGFYDQGRLQSEGQRRRL